MQGVPFPDKQPGGPYSYLQPEILNNIVVLAVINQIEPQVKETLAALKRSKTIGT